MNPEEIMKTIDLVAEDKKINIVKEGLQYLQMASSGDKEKLVRFYWKYAKWFEGFARHDGSIQCFKFALNILQEKSDEQKEILIDLANSLTKVKGYRECEKLLEPVVKDFENEFNSRRKGKFFNALGKVKLMLGNKEEALNFLEKSRKAFSESEEQKESYEDIVSTLNCLAVLLGSKGSGNTLSLLEKSTDFIEKMNPLEGWKMIEIMDYWTCGVCFLEDKIEFYRLIERVEKVLGIYSNEVQLRFYDNLINCSLASSSSLFNEKLHYKYLAFVEKNFENNDKILDRTYYLLACKNFSESEYEKSIKFAEMCLEIRSNYRNTKDLIVINNLLTSCFIELRDIAKAKFHLNESGHLLESFRDEELENQFSTLRSQLRSSINLLKRL